MNTIAVYIFAKSGRLTSLSMTMVEIDSGELVWSLQQRRRNLAVVT
jgi:hypothetical protein